MVGVGVRVRVRVRIGAVKVGIPGMITFQVRVVGIRIRAWVGVKIKRGLGLG